jgi:hypothetical protein
MTAWIARSRQEPMSPTAFNMGFWDKHPGEIKLLYFWGTRMPLGLSLHIGINHPDPKAFPEGWKDLQSCEKTALAMRSLADSCGFWSKCILTEHANASHILAAIELAALTLKCGDIFFLTYAGHGAQIPDCNEDEDDGFDETWVAYDRMIVDDEFFMLWSRFRPGVRVLMLSDSCHSGTISSIETLQRNFQPNQPAEIPALLSYSAALNFYLNHRSFYNAIQQQAAVGITLGCTVLSLSACQDGELTQYSPTLGGVFSGKIHEAWNGRAFQGNYRAFFQAVCAIHPAEDRNPEYRVIGTPNYSFEDQRPFTV